MYNIKCCIAGGSLTNSVNHQRFTELHKIIQLSSFYYIITFGRSIHSPNYFSLKSLSIHFYKALLPQNFPTIWYVITHLHIISYSLLVYGYIGQRNLLYYIYFIIIAITIASIGYYYDNRSEGSSRLSVDDTTYITSSKIWMAPRFYNFSIV